MTESELPHIAVQMLGAHVVIDTDVTALEQGPEAFNAVGMRHIANVFARRVIDGDVIVACA